mmetsp:Transcript_59304/g.139667  ORF Transcript_59304/g.139667 Transcript_59304/m.139667 type:complete len:230 (+) Transcript_59304:2155-2844(+)
MVLACAGALPPRGRDISVSATGLGDPDQADDRARATVQGDGGRSGDRAASFQRFLSDILGNVHVHGGGCVDARAEHQGRPAFQPLPQLPPQQHPPERLHPSHLDLRPRAGARRRRSCSQLSRHPQPPHRPRLLHRPPPPPRRRPRSHHLAPRCPLRSHTRPSIPRRTYLPDGPDLDGVGARGAGAPDSRRGNADARESPGRAASYVPRRKRAGGLGGAATRTERGPRGR